MRMEHNTEKTPGGKNQDENPLPNNDRSNILEINI